MAVDLKYNIWSRRWRLFSVSFVCYHGMYFKAIMVDQRVFVTFTWVVNSIQVLNEKILMCLGCVRKQVI